MFAFSGFARLGHQQQLPAEGVLRERRVGYGGERTIPTMNSFQFTRFARLSLALRAPASGFLEGIDPFEETACWGAAAAGPDVWALPFSLDRLEPTGEAFLVAQGAGDHSIADDGTLVVVDVLGGGHQQLIWRDRTGAKLGEIGRSQRGIGQPALSPDGRRVAVGGQEDASTSADVWLHEVGRAVTQRLTFNPSSENYPAWSPDGKMIVFRSGRSGAGDLFLRQADGTGEAEPLVSSPVTEFESSWSPDGQSVIYGARDPDTGQADLFLINVRGGGAPKALTQTPFSERVADISPDGLLVAYCSDESGSNEIYVREFAAGGGRRQVSENGGCQPRWNADGRELFYVEGETLMAVRITTPPEIEVGRVERLFSDPNLRSVIWSYDVSADGRFVTVEDVSVESESQPDASIHVIENWYEEFRDRK